MKLQLVRSNIFDKSNVVFSSAVKNASCNHGWLRYIVECAFGMLTVASFIMIVMLAIKSPAGMPSVGSRCTLRGCRVVCTKTPFYDEYEDDIIYALTITERFCDTILLTLENPFFENATLPHRWLSRLRTNVHELTIIGGNLQHIASEAFMSQFTTTIESLVFENITITTWESDMLVGLSSLKNLCLKRTAILNIERNALEPVDDTLTVLTVTISGRWSPSNVTGLSNLEFLETVDFSLNRFGNLLGKSSFASLQKCKFLYLTSCRISAIGAGAFDYLTAIEILYLNNNFLVTLSPNLFDRMFTLNHSPRLHLQDNLWYCDCTKGELIRLSNRGMLVVDPVCYSPDNMTDVHLSDLGAICKNDSALSSPEKDAEYLYTNGTCHNTNTTDSFMRVINPISFQPCTTNMTTDIPLALQTPVNYWYASGNLKPPLLTPTFAVTRGDFSMVEISATEGKTGFGLLWYQTSCPNEVYCINTIPNFLRVYNLEEDALFIFCPLELSSGAVQGDKCISYSIHDRIRTSFRFIIIIGTGIGCIIVGALSVYALIRKYPSLLRGNKRILLVKHKNVDALILPPKVASRSVFKEDHVPDFNDKRIFMVSDSNNHLQSIKLIRTKSMRSSKSSDPSYISAFEPTEAQLTEWRLRHLDNISAVTYQESGPHSWIMEDNNSLYYSLSHGSSKSSESLKCNNVLERKGTAEFSA